jgi:hypothetical protein
MNFPVARSKIEALPGPNMTKLPSEVMPLAVTIYKTTCFAAVKEDLITTMNRIGITRLLSIR